MYKKIEEFKTVTKLNNEGKKKCSRLTLLITKQTQRSIINEG